MLIRDIIAAAYRYSWPRLGHYCDPAWVIPVQIEITVPYSDSTLGYIQPFPISTSMENTSMTHVKRDEDIWINET